MRPISELITERDMLDFSQGFNVQRNYLGSRLFPDQKTQYIEAEYSRIVENGNLPTVAMIHGFDTEAHIASRVPFERVVTEQLLIKEKINLTERLRLVTRGLDMQMDSVRRYCFDDVARMAESVVARVEKAKMEALSTGKMTINENNVSMEVDFGVPSDQKVATKWAVADADIIGDIDKWVTIANGKGQTPTVAITSKKVFSLIQRNAAVQKAIFGINGAGILPSLAQVNNLLAQQFNGLTLNIDEERYGVIDTAADAMKVPRAASSPRTSSSCVPSVTTAPLARAFGASLPRSLSRAARSTRSARSSTSPAFAGTPKTRLPRGLRPPACLSPCFPTSTATSSPPSTRPPSRRSKMAIAR